MRISKVLFYELTCPHCGAKITLSASEYEKYKKEMEDYGGRVICQRNGQDAEYINFDCPVCDGYIPVTLAEIDSDEFGFEVRQGVKVFYDTTNEMTIDEYFDKKFGEEEVGENS